MKNRTKALSIVSAIVVVAVGAYFIIRPLTSKTEGISYITRPVAYTDIAATVSETGIVNPVTEVLIGSEVSGTIRTLNVDFNSKVRKGEVLANLDPTTYQAAVDSARANLMLEQANEESATVNVAKMKAELDLANLTVQRDQPLLKQGLINQNQMDTDTTAAESAQQDYLAAQSQVKVAQAQIGVVKGQLEQAQYNLSKTTILSPFDGIVMARNVDVGQTVAASLQTPTLFTLATNLIDMQIDTSVDEADIGGLRQGETAEITVTAYPNVVFSGTVLQVRINPTTVQNVVTYDAVITIHDTSGRLLPGMTAQVTIQVAQKSHVIAVPIAAVLYRPLAASTTGSSSGGGFGGGGGFGAGVVQSGVGAGSGQAVAGAPGSKVTIWKLIGGKPVAQQVVIGLSDGKNIEITSDGVQEGDRIIIAQRRGGGSGSSAQNANAAASAGASGAAGAAPTAANGTRNGKNTTTGTRTRGSAAGQQSAAGQTDASTTSTQGQTP